MIPPYFSLLLFVLSFFISFVFSRAEIAVGYISLESLEKLVESSVPGASLLFKIAHNRRRFHLLLLIGRIMSTIAGVLFLFHFISDSMSIFRNSVAISYIITFITALFIFVMMEGVMPKLFASGELERQVSRFAYFIAFFHIILFPVTLIIDQFLSVSVKKPLELAAKEEALKEFIQSETEYGVIEEEEKEMIESILEFHDTTVREVMVPRIDVIAVEKKVSIDELIAVFEKEGHSRIPMYEERIDNILGVIYAKDLLPVIAELGKENVSLTKIMRKAYYVPETKSISVLLKEFKKTKVHIAVVVDEYGGVAGIVALEDLLEEIVGEIQDEYDEEERDIYWVDDRTAIIDAGLDIWSVNEAINTDIPAEDYDTLAGFVYHQLGVVPKGGEEFVWNNITFSIKEINGNRISKVIIKSEEPILGNIDKNDSI